MKTPPVNLGIPTGVGASAPSIAKSTGGTSGSFAHELSVRWPGNGDLDSDSQPSTSTSPRNPQGGPGKKASAASSRFPSAIFVHGAAAQAHECRNTSNARASSTPVMSTGAHSQAGRDLPPDSGDKSVTRITASFPTTGIAQVAAVSPLATSVGSAASAQTTGMSGALFLGTRVSNQIPPEAKPPVDFGHALAGKQNWVMPSPGEERVQSIAGTQPAAANVENESALPPSHREANASAVAPMPAAGPAEQVGQPQPKSAPVPVANALSDPPTQVNLTGRIQLQMSSREPVRAAPAPSGELKNVEPGVAKLTASSPPMPDVPQDAVPSATGPGRVTSVGSAAPAQTAGMLGSLLLGARVSNQIPPGAEPPGVFGQAVAGQQSSGKERVQSTAGVQAAAANVENESASPISHREANVSTVAPLPAAGPAEQMSQPQPESAPVAVSNALSNPPTQLNLTGTTQLQMASQEPTKAAPPPSGEPRELEAGLAKLAVSSSSTPEVSQEVVSLPKGSIFERQADPPSAVSDAAQHDLDNADAEMPVAPTEAPSRATQPEVLRGRDAVFDLRADSDARLLETSPDYLTLTATSASGVLAAKGGSSLGEPHSAIKGVAPPPGNLSNSVRLRSPESDKGEDRDPAGNRLRSDEGVPETGNIPLGASDGTRTPAGGDSNSALRGASPDAEDNSAADRTPFFSRTASLTGAAEKIGLANTDASPQIALDPSPAMQRNSPAQHEPESPSSGSAANAATVLQNWDGVRASTGLHVSSAYLAQAMGRSELQVDMKSDAWGPVSVHATLSSGQVGAEIQVSDRAAHTALTEGLPALEKTLGDKGIQVVNLDVSPGLGYSHAQSQGQQKWPAGHSAPATKAYTERSANNNDPSAASTIGNWPDDFLLGRVNVRA